MPMFYSIPNTIAPRTPAPSPYETRKLAGAAPAKSGEGVGVEMVPLAEPLGKPVDLETVVPKEAYEEVVGVDDVVAELWWREERGEEEEVIIDVDDEVVRVGV